MTVEPTDHKAVSSAILEIILNKDRWTRFSQSGVRNILAYSWPSHCIKYLDHVETLKVCLPVKTTKVCLQND